MSGGYSTQERIKLTQSRIFVFLSLATSPFLNPTNPKSVKLNQSTFHLNIHIVSQSPKFCLFNLRLQKSELTHACSPVASSQAQAAGQASAAATATAATASTARNHPNEPRTRPPSGQRWPARRTGAQIGMAQAPNSRRRRRSGWRCSPTSPHWDGRQQGLPYLLAARGRGECAVR
ncbi:hypothetical protein CC80DRAFT_147798 [Byssothecium circinans]|uniref:Uncharacterized protein n=1 Tax=Byssothecium circinans TaxID=147558 RepID=A0A6A5TKZ0_9PLEO|nr:hypothetical protein CC80DRAFT_147798 [Byssothecium circinans]